MPTSVLASVGRALALSLLAAVAFLGGVTATQLWPVHTQTDYFAADLSLTPALDSTARLPMVVGDVVLTFDGPLPAPGLRARPSVRQEVTELLPGRRVDTARLQPGREELREAIDGGVRQVAWTYALGALLSSLLVLLTYAVARPHHMATVAAAAATATMVALVGPGAAAYLAYRSDNVTAFRTTSLLSLVQTNAGVLADLAGRADQGAIYVSNLLALSDALRQEFTPTSGQGTVAATFLLVSDVHGMNQYPLMRQVVARERVDAVIDLGDLLNFGQPREGVLTGIYEGIESLGVPYIYVRGNHDAASPGDESVLRRVSRVPNVLPVEPTAGQFVRVEVNGVSVSGFNDARYYNERSADFGAAQEQLAARFRGVTEGLQPTDLVIAHQPYSARRVEAGAARLSGHMHSPLLERGHIQVSSFTGGGLVNQFRLPPLTEQARTADDEEPETAGELQGHPYSFDVLRFAEDCSIMSITRYSYRNLASGRPQYDQITVIDGRRIQPDPPEGRTCGPALGVTTRPLLASGGDPDRTAGPLATSGP